jgi:ABC-type multidrug transport system fused ATPase/permease subunit
LLRIDAGRILLDGLDVTRITVDRLRSHLALIPQAPLLFSGSVRANLDPTGVLAARGLGDADVWRLLGEVGLGDIVRALGGIDAALPAASLPLGQRQLFSLVR